MKEKSLAQVGINETAIVCKVRCKRDIKRRFLDLGIVNGTKIEALYKSPYGDPTAYLIRGTVIALRAEDSKDIIVY